jgi:hypothetical protein
VDVVLDASVRQIGVNGRLIVFGILIGHTSVCLGKKQLSVLQALLALLLLLDELQVIEDRHGATAVVATPFPDATDLQPIGSNVLLR